MVRFLSIDNEPSVSVMTLLAGNENVIVSPELASAIAWRREPAPLSFVLVTEMATACPAAARLSSVMAIR